MMENTMATASPKPSLSPRRLPPFTPIRECQRELEDDDDVVHHPPTPLHPPTVSSNKCRPTIRHKITIMPLENQTRSSNASPNGLFKSIVTSLTKKSPAATPLPEKRQAALPPDLSCQLASATRRRDEAILEASRLKTSVAELEKKLDKLESYCHELKTGLDGCTKIIVPKIKESVVDHFVCSVSEARTNLKILSRALTLQLRQMGPKVQDQVSVLLNPYDIKISLSKNPRALMCYLEALITRAFFEDFESVGFEKSSSSMTLNPLDRAERNFESFIKLNDLSWEDVLSKGTKHFSEDFSRFCDRKMSEIVTMLGWNRAWPEPLLQAFFNGSKSVWLVHLLANSVHPSLPLFRVDKGVKFDPVYMEDMGETKARSLVPGQVRIMVTPGFYVGNNVIKCKVLCRYHNGGFSDKGLTTSPI